MNPNYACDSCGHFNPIVFLCVTCRSLFCWECRGSWKKEFNGLCTGFGCYKTQLEGVALYNPEIYQQLRPLTEDEEMVKKLTQQLEEMKMLMIAKKEVEKEMQNNPLK